MKDDQITGGIFGVAIGDALGVPAVKYFTLLPTAITVLSRLYSPISE